MTHIRAARAAVHCSKAIATLGGKAPGSTNSFTEYRVIFAKRRPSLGTQEVVGRA